YYRRRAQVELEWDILNNGYLDNRHEIRELENEKQIARFETAGQRQAYRVDTLQFAFQAHFNHRKASLVRDYLALLKDQHSIATELYQLNYKPWEEVIGVTSARAQAEVELNNLVSASRRFANLELPVSPDKELPLLNIDIQNLIEEGRFETLQDSIYMQQVGKIDNEYNSWRDISLSTFVRYNYYNSTTDINLSNVRNREYFSVGLNLSVPLPLLRSNNKKIAEARENILRADLMRAKNQSSQRIFTDYLRYQEKLKEYLRNHQQLLQLKTRIRKQQQRDELNDPSYSPLILFELLVERLEVSYDLLTIKQEMYEILVGLREKVPNSNFSQFLYPINADDYFAGIDRQRSRTVYLWSSLFKEMTNEQLVDYLDKHQINRLLLSTGNDSLLRDKAASFVKIAEENGITVEWMIGDNELLLPGHEAELKDIFRTGKQLGVSGIHLDVEAHTNSDWEIREKEYKTMYLRMIKEARELADSNGLTISVSVPVFYDSIIDEVASHADKIYVMAYGLDSMDKMKEKLGKELNLRGNQLSIALRPEDFDSLDEFQVFVDKVKSELKVNAIAIHDLEAFMKLDNTEVTLNYYEE
ncbi:MAG: TolC family protein, partial [Balneolaceae bacterium]|nr:TolC family protein [Balneolaceae bacterium]